MLSKGTISSHGLGASGAPRPLTRMASLLAEPPDHAAAGRDQLITCFTVRAETRAGIHYAISKPLPGRAPTSEGEATWRAGRRPAPAGHIAQPAAAPARARHSRPSARHQRPPSSGGQRETIALARWPL